MDEGCESYPAALGKKIKARRKEGGSHSGTWSPCTVVTTISGDATSQAVDSRCHFLVKVAVILQTTPSARARSAKELPAVWLQASFLQLI